MIQNYFKPGFLNSEEKLHIWWYTETDLRKISKLLNPAGSDNPSSTVAILLVCLMDIWGSIVGDRFGLSEQGGANIGKILTMLQKSYPRRYIFTGAEKNDLTDVLRNNLVHNYGLKVLAMGGVEYWPNIFVRRTGKAISKNKKTGRWDLNIWLLLEDLLKVLEEWLRSEGVV